MQTRTNNTNSKSIAPFLLTKNNKNDSSFVPKSFLNMSSKIDLLSEGELQSNVTKQEKVIIQQDAVNQEAKLPRFSIDKVKFSILDAATLNKMKIVNVSNKIDRDQPSESELSSSLGFGKRSTNPGCYKSEYDKTSEARLLNPTVSVTAYAQMGTVDPMKICQTCHKTNVDCPGHLGEIKLNCAFPHPLYRDYIVMVLTSVCNSCSGLLISEDHIVQQGINKLPTKLRLKQIATIAEKAPKCKRNPQCTINPKYSVSKNENYSIMYVYPKGDKEKKPKPIKEIQTILKNISDKDAAIMGFTSGSHPKNMILESFAVIPPCARAHTTRDGVPKEDHLTIAYDEIIRDNYRYYNAPDENKRENAAKDLYFHISHFIDNTDNKYCHSPTQYIKSVKERIVKKEGLIRSNIMGKRVNFCARSVIGPDSKLRFGEIGIPEIICKKLTVSEVVHEKNLAYIQDLWDRRQISHFCFDNCATEGQRYTVTDKTYRQKTLSGELVRPKIGFRVDRYVTDGDVVMVNRQPTLYKYGMPGNFIRKVPRMNIGIHMCETSMRNADFDGDEINVHVLQATDARVEAMTFANSQACIPNALRNNAMCGMLYNSLSSFYIMTRKPLKNDTKGEELRLRIANGEFPKHEAYAMTHEVILSKEEIQEAHDLLTYKKDLDSLPARLAKHNINPLSGSALFSSILPATFQYQKGEVIIHDGVLVAGRIGKNQVGRTEGSIQMSIWKWYGRDRAVAFLTDATFLSDWFIEVHGFSFGYSDISLTEDVRNKIQEIISISWSEANMKISKLNNEKQRNPNLTEMEAIYYERQTYGYLSDFRTSVENIGKDAMSPEHPLNIMTFSGSKGSATYTNSIVGIKGQELLSVGRPEPKISGNTRCLPYFEKNSNDIRARGFICNSYTKGLTPHELYFMAESTRESNINSGTSVRRSGALHHRLIKVLEDCKACYDGSVRNAGDNIFQLGYFDGYDGGELVNTKTSYGEILSFINISEAAERINSEFSN